MEEEKTGESEGNSETLEKLRKNPWMVSSIVLGIVVLILLFFTLKPGLTGNVIGGSDAGGKLVDFLNAQVGGGVEYVSSEDLGNIYEVTVSYQDQTIPVYITKDGKYYVSGATPITGQATQPQTQETPAEVPKSDKPKVDLYVMSFCPYGVRAETNIMPILELLGDSIDFNVKYIASVSGATIDTAQSLHGLTEAKQDAVQLIIKEKYESKFLSYLTAFNKNCYPLGYSDAAKIEACWKSEATKLGMNVQTIETAAYGAEGVALLKADGDAADAVGASGSPTLIINGVKSSAIYSGTSATQDAICSAFNTAPSKCETQVQSSTTDTTSSGSC